MISKARPALRAPASWLGRHSGIVWNSGSLILWRGSFYVAMVIVGYFPYLMSKHILWCSVCSSLLACNLSCQQVSKCFVSIREQCGWLLFLLAFPLVGLPARAFLLWKMIPPAQCQRNSALLQAFISMPQVFTKSKPMSHNQV